MILLIRVCWLCKAANRWSITATRLTIYQVCSLYSQELYYSYFLNLWWSPVLHFAHGQPLHSRSQRSPAELHIGPHTLHMFRGLCNQWQPPPGALGSSKQTQKISEIGSLLKGYVSQLSTSKPSDKIADLTRSRYASAELPPPPRCHMCPDFRIYFCHVSAVWNLRRLAVHDPCPNQEQLIPDRYCSREWGGGVGWVWVGWDGVGVTGNIWRPDAQQFVSTITLTSRIVGSVCVLLREPVCVRCDNCVQKDMSIHNNVNIVVACVPTPCVPRPDTDTTSKCTSTVWLSCFNYSRF